MLLNRSERALLLIDITNSFMHPESMNYIASTKEIIPYIAGELAYFRERQRLVIYCSKLAEPALAFESQIIQDLLPRSGEIHLFKSARSAFHHSGLKELLDRHNVGQVTIVGVNLATSILLTAASALDAGFKVVVPETCVASRDEKEHQAGLRIVTAWLS